MTDLCLPLRTSFDRLSVMTPACAERLAISGIILGVRASFHVTQYRAVQTHVANSQ